MPGPVPIIIGGDIEGHLHFLTMEGATPLLCAQGAHNDNNQPVAKVFIFPIGNNQAPVSIDATGNFRLWGQFQ